LCFASASASAGEREGLTEAGEKGKGEREKLKTTFKPSNTSMAEDRMMNGI
jgi:hypothetical protein